MSVFTFPSKIPGYLTGISFPLSRKLFFNEAIFKEPFILILLSPDRVELDFPNISTFKTPSFNKAVNLENFVKPLR